MGLAIRPGSASAEVLRIVFVRSDAESPTSKRLEAELKSLGLTVVTKPLPGGQSRAALEQIARSENAIAAVQVIAHGTKAELWIADRVTGKTVFREIATASSGDSTDDTIAVGISELLRASLMEVNAPSRLARQQPHSPKIRELGYAELKPKSGESSSTVWLTVGSGVEPGVRGVGVSVVGQAAAGFQTINGLGVEALAGMTLVPGVVDRPAGRASLSSHWFGAGATVGFGAPRAVVNGRAGLALLAVRIEAEGEGSAPPFRATTEASWAAGPYLHGGPALGTASFRFRLDAGVLLLLRAPTIHFGDEPVGVWGGPALFLSLGIEAWGAS